VTLLLRVELSASLFDGVDFGSLQTMEGVLDAAGAPNENLREGSFLKVTIHRQDD